MQTDFWRYSDDEKRAVFNEIKQNTTVTPKAIEKDWWVSHVIKSLFSLRCSEALTFKGGTSLSKAWGIINRFSEDVDISIDKSFFGLSGETRSSRDRIRKLSRKYIREELCPELASVLWVNGAAECEPLFKISKDSDADPSVILIPYRSIYPEEDYIKGTVKVEISCRNMFEPREMRPIRPIVAECSPMIEWPELMVPTVTPDRTFLEKVFLLHEEYQKNYPRHKRMSRHLFDLAKLYETGWAEKALANRELFDAIVEHRREFNAIRGIDYSKHTPENIRVVPPDNILPLWREDYEQMIRQFIYGPVPTFDEILEILWKINALIGQGI